MTWHTIIVKHVQLAVSAANLILLVTELGIFKSFLPRLSLPLLFLNFCLSSALVSSHFDSTSKLHFLLPDGYEKLSFREAAHNLLCLSGSLLLGIMFASILSNQLSLPSCFLLALLIALRWTSPAWKRQSLLVWRQTFFSLVPESVNFDTVLFADIMTTFARPLSVSISPSSTIRAVVFSIPYFIRIKQCLVESSRKQRRWNTLKYIALLVSALILSFIPRLPLAFMLFPVIAVAYASWWDVFMDWGAAGSSHLLSACLNTVIRYLPLASKLFLAGPNICFLLDALEVFRRACWMVLRMQNHQKQQQQHQYRTI